MSNAKDSDMDGRLFKKPTKKEIEQWKKCTNLDKESRRLNS
jgi:hypothetical protein